MRKFILSTTVLGALFSGIGVAKQAQSMPRDWRMVLLWVSWGISVALAVGTVIDKAAEAELED